MKILFRGFAILVILLFLPLQAGSECPPYDHSINIKVIKDYGELKYDHSKSSSEFHKIAGSRFDEHTKGLTVANFDISVSAQASHYTDNEEGFNCVYLDEINLYLSYQDILVLIDKKYPKNSCEYKVILAHENQHVAIHKKSLDYYAPYIIGAMEKALQNLEPMEVRGNTDADTEEAVNIIINGLMEKISGMLDFFEEERDKANARIDTRENYNKEHARCANW